MKRIKMIALTLCLVLSICIVGALPSSAISTSKNYYSYKENYIKNECTYDYLVNEMRLPYRGFVETLDNDIAFQAELAAWKLATLSPDSLVTQITQSNQCKYYQAILMDLLVRNTQEESFMNNVQSFKDTLHVSAWKNYVDYNSEILKDIPITSENADTILTEMKSMGNFSNALKYADAIGDCIDYATDMNDLFDKLTKVEMIAQMSDSYAAVLNNMSKNCGGNIYLKTAIDNISLIFSEDLSTEQIYAIFSAQTGADMAYKAFMKQVKKMALESMGLVGDAIDLAQSAGTAVANSWFGTEDMVNDYYEMRALYEIEDLIRYAVKNTSGSTFCAAFKLYENTCLMGCDYSKKYVEPLYTSLFGKLFAWATNQNYEAYSAQLDTLKKDITFTFEMIDVGADSWYVIDTQNTNNMNTVNSSFISIPYAEADYINKNESVKFNLYSTYGSNNGNNITLNQDLIVYTDFKITGGTIDLNGHTLTIEGNLQQNDGTIYINGGTLNVKGNYSLENGGGYCYALLNMTNENDRVNVDGNFMTKSDKDHENYLTAGIMSLKGDFDQICNSGTNSKWNFCASGNHKIIFDGNEEQTISFGNTSSGFSNVEFKNSNIDIKSSIRGWTLQNDTIINNNCNLYLDGTLDLNGHTLTINGNLQQNDGTIYINGGTLNVKGDYSLENGGGYCYALLNMTSENDRVNVDGNFMTKSDKDHEIYLTAGIMTLKGDFDQIYNSGTNSKWNFCASGNHKIIFDGNEEQTISFGNTSSGFSNVEFKNSNIDIKSSIRGWTLQRDTIFGNGLEKGMTGTFDLNGHKLTVNGNLYQSGGEMLINKGTLEVTGDYRIQAYAYNQTNDQMEFSRSSGYITMNTVKDYVKIKGNFYTESSADTSNAFVAGTMEIGGDFKQIGTSSSYDDNFACSGSHKVILNGTKQQHISFDSTVWSHFNDLELTNTDIVFDTTIRGWTLQRDTTFGNGLEKGMTGTFDLNGHKLTVNGNLYQFGGKMFINKGILEVTGDYRIQAYAYNQTNDQMEFGSCSGYITMNTVKDYVKVKGDFYTQSTGNSGYNVLSAGTMEIGGDLKQIGSSDSNFQCRGSHTVILNGTKQQYIKFDNPRYSYFNDLKLTNDKDTGYIFDPDNCWKNLYLDSDIKGVTLYCIKNSLKQGLSMPITSKVEGINVPSQSVTWTIAGNTDADTKISDGGILTIGMNEQAEEITVTATSVQDPTKSASVAISIEKIDPVVNGVIITPSVVSSICGEKCDFSARVYGLYNPPQTVIWTVTGNNSADTKISEDGILTIAKAETSDKLTVVATSDYDKTKSAQVDVTVILITNTPTVNKVIVTMADSETQTLTAVVTGSNNPSQNVVWSVSGNNSENTSISPDGKLTIGEDETATMVIVRATSVEDSSKYGEFTIKLKSDTVNGLLGDANEDGVISVLDALIVQKHILESETLTDTEAAIADVDKNGTIDISDVIVILKYIVSPNENSLIGKPIA